MAREIKLTVKSSDTVGNYNVRNIPDKMEEGEEVVAAVWQQDGQIKWFTVADENFPHEADFLKRKLEIESGYRYLLNDPVDGGYLMQFISNNW